MLAEYYADSERRSHWRVHVVVAFNEVTERLEIEIATLDWGTPAAFRQTLEQAIVQAFRSNLPSLKIEADPTWRVDLGF